MSKRHHGSPETGRSSEGGNKFSRKHLLNPKKLRKGETRWNQFTEILQQHAPRYASSPLLDFGCGIGYFVREGLLRGKDIWGVDVSESKTRRFRKLVEVSDSPANWKKRCLVGNGHALPFRTDRFAAVCSWYVLEHLEVPGSVIRELIRVTAPAGLIVLRAQDARNSWEGHCRIPWVPFLSGRLAAAWMEEFGADAGKREGVVDITQPQIIAILETLGCAIVSRAPEPETLIDQHWEMHTEEAVRRTARRIIELQADNAWNPQPENLYIVARKLPRT